MAEYAGLEIRIGGDTTKLNKALRASTSAAAELQRELRQVTTAMRMDPANMGILSTRIKLTTDRMEALRAKVNLAENAMEQLGDRAVDIKGFQGNVKQLAEQTHNVAMQAKLADEKYNEVVSTIATLYEQFNKVAKNAAIERIAEKVKGVRQATEIAKTSSEEFAEALKRWDVPDSTIRELDQLRNMQFHFEGRSDELDKMLAEMERLGIFTESDIEQVKQLKQQFAVALDSKKAYDLADQFENLGTRIMRDKAEVQELSRTIRELDTHSKVSMSDDFMQTKGEIDEIDRSIKLLDEDMQHAQNHLRIDPNSLEVAKRLFDDMTQKAELLNRREALLKENMDRLNSPELQKVAEKHQNIAEWIEQARAAAQSARAEYTQQAAELTNLNTAASRTSDTMELLRSKISAYESGFSGHDAFTKLEAQMKDAQKQAENLRKEWERMNSDLYGRGEDSRELATYLDTYNMKLEALANNAEAVAKAFMEGKASSEEWEAALDAQTNFIDSEASIVKMAQDYREASEEAEKLAQELKKLDDVRIATPEDYEKWLQQLEKLEEEYPQLQREISETRNKLKELDAVQEQANDELDYANQAAEMREYTQEIEKNTAAKKKNNETFDQDKSHFLTLSNLKSIGMTLYSTLTPLITGIGYAMVSASEQIDSAYRNMRKTVDGTEEDFQRLYDAAIEFSNTHVTSAAELLEIEAIGGELGIATENLQTFAESVASIADSTNLSAENAATALGHLANIMKIQPSEYTGFADALVRLGNNGASTEEEIANIAERIGAMGAIVGMSTPDVLAWASTIASTGQNAEAAGTAISKTMSFMETAVAAAGGTMEVSMQAVADAIADGSDQLTIFASMSDMSADQFVEAWSSDPEKTFEDLSTNIEGARNSLQMIADIAGMTAEEFAAAWETDPTAALEAFIKGLNAIEAAGGSADAMLANLGIRSVRQKQAIEGLMQTVGLLDNNLAMSSHAWEGISDQWGKAGDAANEAAKKAEGFSGQLQIMKNMWQGALASLGEGAVPLMKQASEILADLTDWFESLSTETKSLIIELGLLGVALGPALTLISTFGTSAITVKNWASTTFSAFSKVAKAATGGAEAVSKIGVATEGLGIGFGTFAVGAAAIAVFAAAAWSAYEDILLQKKATEGLRTAISNVARVTGDYTHVLDPAQRTVAELAESVENLRQRQADLVDEIGAANDQYSTTAGTLEYYARTIDDLYGKSNRSEEETTRLRAAIQALNDECGSSYALDEYGQIIDTQTGQIMDNTDAIWANVEARRAQAVIDYYSDAYSEAVANMQEWEDTIESLTAKQEELQSSRFNGMNVWEIDEQDMAAWREWNEEVNRVSRDLAEAQREHSSASAAVAELEAKMGEATDTINEYTNAQEAAAAAAEEAAKRQETVADDVTGNMKRLSDVVADDRAFNNMADALDMLTVGAEELNGVDMSRLSRSFDGSIADVMSALEDGGVYLTTFRGAMEQTGVSSETLSTVTAAAFQTMYDSCGQNIDKTATLLTHMDTVMADVDGQQVTFYVGDNGTIIDSEGKIYDLNTDIASIPDEVLVAYYGDNTDALDKALETKRKVSEVDGDSATVTIDATGNATDVLDNVANKIDRLRKQHVNIPVNAGNQATGGMNSRPVIPAHATGYIATGPTLTNQGWIGEDGIEAVSNWATGGAVVPLTNTKYMLPIADAIADGMAQRGAGGGQTYNLYINDAKVNDDPAIQAAFINLMETLARKGAMNVGR